MVPLFFHFLLICYLCEIIIQADVEKNLSIVQDTGVISAEIGKNVTLHCLCVEDVTHLSWYRQSMEGKLELIFTRFKGRSKATTSESFTERFVALPQDQECTNHLTIKDLRPSDSGMYYCGTLHFNVVHFGQGAFLYVRMSLSNARVKVLQPTEERLQLGDSLNMSCKVNSDSQCPEEQRFYWIKVSATESITTYPSAGQCSGLFETGSQKQNCSSHFVKQSINSTDAGIYYCVVTSCDEIIYGDGTRVLVHERSFMASHIPVYCLSVAFIVSLNVLFLMTSLMYKWTKELCSVGKGVCFHSTRSQIHDQDTVYNHVYNLQKSCEHSEQFNDIEAVCLYVRVNIKCNEMEDTSEN